MAISGDYSIPVNVNGFSCRNCTDVGYAAKFIDPAHPKSGPFNATAATDPTRPPVERMKLGDAKGANDALKGEGGGYARLGLAPATLPAGSVVEAFA